MPDAQWGQTETLEFEAEKGLLQGHERRMGGWCLKKTPNSWKGFSKAFLKTRWGWEWVSEYVISSCTILWLVDDDQSLGARKIWELCVLNHQVVNSFHLVVVIWKTQEICMRYYHLVTSERSYSRGYGRRVCPQKAP